VLRRPTKTCLIAATPRSGSYWLAEAFYETSLLGDPQEYFLPAAQAAWRQDLGLPPEATYARFVRAALAHSATANGVAGAKLMWTHFQALARSLREIDALADLDDVTLADRFFPEVHYVHLVRRDTVRQAISFYRAERSSSWWRLRDEPAAAAPSAAPAPQAPAPQAPAPPGEEHPFEPDFARIHHIETMLVQEAASWDAYFATTDRPILELCYEEILGDRRSAVERALALLGIDPPAGLEVPESRMLRQSDATTDEWASRYEELKPVLAAGSRPAPAEAASASAGTSSR